MRDGQPSRRYRAFLEENRKEEETLRELKQLEATDDATEEANDMKSEVLKSKRRVEKIEMEKKEEAKKKKETARLKELKKKEKKGSGKRKVEISASKKKREEKRRKLMDE